MLVRRLVFFVIIIILSPRSGTVSALTFAPQILFLHSDKLLKHTFSRVTAYPAKSSYCSIHIVIIMHSTQSHHLSFCYPDYFPLIFIDFVQRFQPLIQREKTVNKFSFFFFFFFFQKLVKRIYVYTNFRLVYWPCRLATIHFNVTDIQ